MNTDVISYATTEEEENRNDLLNQLRSCPVPSNQLLANLGLFLTSKDLSRVLLMQHLYEKIIDIPGVIIEFGVMWGQNLALFSALRGIFEPFNRHRKIIGFDTFSGFPNVSVMDGTASFMQEGHLSVTEDYQVYLDQIMGLQEKANPLAHIKKYELIAGDANIQIHSYLYEHPETIVALAYFDFDLYEPTLRCLEAIRPHVTKGTVLAFDELNDRDSPGETRALMKVFDLSKIKLRRYRYASRASYLIVGEV